MTALLALPISPADCNARILTPALALLPKRMDSAAARTMLIAIALQESNLNARIQMALRPGMPNGPARGLWQFERGGGVAGVLSHTATAKLAFELCESYSLRPNREDAWNALQSNDILAAGFARLLLWTDSAPLPTEEQAGWELYLRTWRPGKPHPERWPRNFKLAQEAIA